MPGPGPLGGVKPDPYPVGLHEVDVSAQTVIGDAVGERPTHPGCEDSDIAAVGRVEHLLVAPVPTKGSTSLAVGRQRAGGGHDELDRDAGTTELTSAVFRRVRFVAPGERQRDRPASAGRRHTGAGDPLISGWSCVHGCVPHRRYLGCAVWPGTETRLASAATGCHDDQDRHGTVSGYRRCLREPDVYVVGWDRGPIRSTVTCAIGPQHPPLVESGSSKLPEPPQTPESGSASSTRAAAS